MSRPLVCGYDWSIELTLAPASGSPPVYFPIGCALKAEIRERSDSALLATLSTTDTHITRITDQSIRVTVPAAVSLNWKASAIKFDVIRTDVAPDTHYGFTVTVPVQRPITKSTGTAP